MKDAETMRLGDAEMSLHVGFRSWVFFSAEINPLTRRAVEAHVDHERLAELLVVLSVAAGIVEAEMVKMRAVSASPSVPVSLSSTKGGDEL